MSVKKVKLTQEQANAIERIKDKDYAINVLVAGKRPDNPLCELEVSELAKAFYIGYEVEPEFKVGNWAVWRSTEGIDVIKQIEKVEGYRIWADWLDEGSLLFAPSDEIRHATPEEISKEKERRWWAKHGRGVWELKKNDVIFNQSYVDWYPDIIKNTNKYNVELLDGNFIPRKLVMRDYKVVCFADDRKDLK